MGSFLAATARSAGHVSGAVLVLGLVGWGVLRLGKKASVRRPLSIVLVAAVLGFMVIAVGVASH